MINGWRLFYFQLFAVTLSELEATVTQLAQKNPIDYKTHPKTRLLASIYKAITQSVPANPDHPDFRLGKTLGDTHTHWRRVKKGMPNRYRLFFRFNSLPYKLIVYVWFNDENALRKTGSKTDVYTTFKRMLARGEVPRSIQHLLEQSAEQTK